jgi:hypothetical protein
MVVERDANEIISKKERDHLENATLDFVIYNKEMLPEFVIEFDGPCHNNDRKQIQDIIKNRILAKARLPLLRIDDSLISGLGTTSLLKYLCERFLAWKSEKDDIENEIVDRLPEKMSEDDYLDPWYDPTVVFDLRHPFPESIKIADRLYKQYNMISNFLDPDVYFSAGLRQDFVEFRRNRFGDGPLQDYSRRMERSYVLERHSHDDSGKLILEIIHELWVIADYVWGYPTGDGLIFKDLVPSVHFGIPGTSIDELMSSYCDYQALSQTEKWADEKIRDL